MVCCNIHCLFDACDYCGTTRVQCPVKVGCRWGLAILVEGWNAFDKVLECRRNSSRGHGRNSRTQHDFPTCEQSAIQLKKNRIKLVPKGSTSKPRSWSVSSKTSCFHPSSSYMGLAPSWPTLLLNIHAEAQSLNKHTPIRVLCSLSIESSSDLTSKLEISQASTRIRAGFLRNDDPRAKFAAALIAAKPPEHPIPCSSIFSTPLRSPSSLTT